MEYIVVILVSIISLIVLKFAFEIKIKNINKIKKIGNDKKLNDIANNLPSNQKICEEILKMLGNNSVKINVVEDKKVISPQTNLEREELRKALIERLDELNENERLVITLYYYEKLTLKEIGKVLEISESRVSQIHSKAIIKLRSKLMTSFGDYGDIF